MKANKPRADSSWIGLRPVVISIAIAAVILPLMAFWLSLDKPTPKQALFLYQQYRIEQRSEKIVSEMLEEIGHGVSVYRIRAVPRLARNACGTYYPESHSISITVPDFSEGIRIYKYSLAQVLGHECVHALFHQARLSKYQSGDLNVMTAEEVAADVIGAHLAGRVIELPDEARRRVTMACLGLSRLDSLHPSATVPPQYNPPPRLINEMHRICDETPDIWTAAHAIADKYFVVNESGE